MKAKKIARVIFQKKARKYYLKNPSSFLEEEPGIVFGGILGKYEFETTLEEIYREEIQGQLDVGKEEPDITNAVCIKGMNFEDDEIDGELIWQLLISKGVFKITFVDGQKTVLKYQKRA
ncbi:MAG: hypothetical protein ACLUD1_12420 [Clostridia bacterium]